MDMMRMMYPALARSFELTALEKAVDAADRGLDVPYAAKLQMSVVTGQQTDATLSLQYLQEMRKLYDVQPEKMGSRRARRGGNVPEFSEAGWYQSGSQSTEHAR
jgi:hypothetical protein